MAKNVKVAIYLRISKDPKMTGAAIERQREDCLNIIEFKGWTLFGEYVDQSISAFSGKERPKFDQMLDDFRNNKFDIIIAWKLDRLSRNTHDFSEMVYELADQYLRIYTTDTGELDLTRSDSRFLANQFINFAQFESERKSERLIRGNLQRAKNGTMKKGYRPFGYDRDYNIIPHEAEIIRSVFDAYLKGSSINSITKAIAGINAPNLPDIPQSPPPSAIRAKELGKPVAENATWTRNMTRNLLTNPRYAGYVAYIPYAEYKKINVRAKWADYIVKGGDGRPIDAEWEPIVDKDTWWAAQKKLEDYRNIINKDGTPRRHSNARLYFGTGLYRCSVCGKPMRVSSGAYRCDGHVSRRHEKVDEFVLEVARQRLALPDLSDLLPAIEHPRVALIAAEVAACSGEIARVRHDYKAQLIEAELYNEIVSEQQMIIERLEAERLSLIGDNATSEILGASDPVEAFNALTDPGQIHTVLDYLMTITLHPHPRGMRQSPEALSKNIEIEWKTR